MSIPCCASFALALILLLGATACTAPTADPPTAAPRQRMQSFEKQVVLQLNYLLYLPPGYAADPDKKWPLILFLHGAGERGSNLNLIKNQGLPKLIEKGQDFPAIIVSPQCPARGWWEARALVALLDTVQETYRVDVDRVYVTGMSMGGFGTWDLALRYYERFAAIAPICGGGVPPLAIRYKNMGVWVFHGDADGGVPVECSDLMVAALKKVGADVKYTRYPGVGHNSWTQTYDNPELYTWLLAHKRQAPTTTPSPPTTPTTVPTGDNAPK